MEKRTKLMLCFYVANVILLSTAIFCIFRKLSIDENNIFSCGQVIISLQVVYLALSLKIVGPRVKAVVILLGDPIYEVGSGLALVPFGFSWLEIIPQTVIQMQIPGEPEKIDRSGDDNKVLPEGMVWPIRVTTGFEEVAIKNFPKEDIEIIKSDPLKKRMSIEVTGYIRLRISNGVDYLKSLGSIKELEKQVRDAFEATIAIEFGKRTPGLITTHLEKINEALFNDMRKVFETSSNWGLKVEDVKLLERDLTHDLNRSLRNASMADVDIQTAKSTRDQRIATAEGEKQRLTLEGEGKAAAEKAILEARGDGLKKLAEVASTPGGQIALQLQLASETLREANYSIVQPDVAGLAAGVQETLKRIGAEQPKTPPKSAGTP